VGRIQPQHGNASNFIGTGSLINRDAGLILTNYHVIKQAEQQFGVAMTQTDPHHIRVDGALEIDFVGESGSLKTNCYRIVEVSLPEGYGPVFSGLDVALARIEPTDRSEPLPTPVPMLSAEADYANGAITSLALVGFPAAPSVRDGENVDWDFVIRTLFGNKFGVKRLAPGRFSHALGSHRDDQVTRRALGHDATTFGGASGALVSAWLDVKSPCFAIHFGGATESSNYALSFAVAGDALKDIGVSFGHA
jgi:serine protease